VLVLDAARRAATALARQQFTNLKIDSMWW
jgi:hypothetical protein